MRYFIKYFLVIVMMVSVIGFSQFANAQITEPNQVTFPNLGASLKIGDTYTITWLPSGAATVDITIYLSTVGAAGYAQVAADVPNTGSYVWNTNNALLAPPDGLSSLVAGNNYYIYVSDGTNAGQSSIFSITGNAKITPVGEAHAAGANISLDSVVYRIEVGGSRSPFTSAGAYRSYKFNTWGNAFPGTTGDKALPLTTYTPSGSTETKTYFIPPRNGSLINDNGTVYLIIGGLRAGFTSEAVFKGLGYSFSNVYAGDTSFMVSLAPINSSEQLHPDGTLINDNGTLYVMKNGYRMGIPNMAILDSWGYWPSEAVPANSFDRQAQISGVLEQRLPAQLNI